MGGGGGPRSNGPPELSQCTGVRSSEPSQLLGREGGNEAGASASDWERGYWCRHLLSGTQCSMASCLVDGSLQHSVRHWSVPETYSIDQNENEVYSMNCPLTHDSLNSLF